MSLTDNAIARIRELIRSGALPPGAKLPPEQQLAAELGLSRNLMREAVKALVVARVLEIRRGDGTYVTSLQPRLLLEGLAVAVELLHGETLLELTETRRLFEPVATGLAARRMTPEALAVVARELEAMRAARDDVELLVHHDAAFHSAVLAATGNETLVSLLDGISGRTLRGRIWRALVDEHASARTLTEHEAIYDALAAGDAALAEATALVHVSSTEHWLHRHLEAQRAVEAEAEEADETAPLPLAAPAPERTPAVGR
ncbi:GntR family transcriptional regulator, transcriptional repressor for pyruvate dehydrogenase complex [Streptomyces zhaozhouensis]|uniref:GntR family transcriptional regulator, transcriptional repressor for pyruvate dehydrogenase complex n=1 Tax=Streptomyces zhaozhouensis TaxID=1300267 RepID=A0A286DZ64_9ACTN|nr:FCD domain-containing protein [Streptomyces zhaozhouensis]SOD63956.1 GntR family transcriptional regulator, transcriptional repressor for pyruvate dehydrogenase complex [Streptomyces zhaozhouensis]